MGHNPGSEAGVYNLKQVVRPRGYCGCQCAQRASHRAHAQLLTLTPLRISFMIFKRLSLFFIFLTCQERITDRTSIHVSGSRFASDAKSQRYLRLLLGKNFRCQWWAVSPTLLLALPAPATLTTLLSLNSVGLTVSSSQVLPKSSSLTLRFQSSAQCFFLRGLSWPHDLKPLPTITSPCLIPCRVLLTFSLFLLIYGLNLHPKQNVSFTRARALSNLLPCSPRNRVCSKHF